MKAEIDSAMLATVDSAAFIMGNAVAELERQLAEYVGVKHCITCANCTDALRLALTTWNIGAGDAVFVPDFTFFASAEAVALRGATPIFVDVCRNYYNIDAEDLVVKINYVESQTDLHPAAVIAVDLFGMPADYAAIKPLCKAHNLLLLEDGAQGFGGSYDGSKACSFGDIAATSFFPAKPLGCYGDGGALFTDNDEWAETLRSLCLHGRGKEKYDNVRIGINSRLDTVQAAVLQVKMRHFDEELAAVNRIAQSYSTLLGGRVSLPEVPATAVSSWAQYTIRSDNRDLLKARLHEAGIPSAVYYPRTMSLQRAFAPVMKYQRPCPVAEELSRSVLSLPMHPYLTDDEIELIATTI
jgi:dTDP-4-amino-4,6-dideoxygalactose transaminase